ncbi:DUF6571 family protein [Streptomyces albidus (ex Kaewkla and Franco 2022)]|uniref:DUF6571 family protein n=1 Tax=Streptomyces albidus (ex Kaewkla and Franco 2022) TaxID=722709 RepID=UPI0015EEB882|nr:DUF6571 family protein [Streptomyces albidus (ex Kaewkla and Franco 2022)]
MNLSDLRFADFSSLGEAVTDWAQMVKKLKQLADDASEQLKGKADKANWAGANATVTRDFITKTSREFKDAHSEAESIYNILNDTKTELEGYKKQLNERIDRGIKEHNLTVTETGDSFTVTMNVHPDRSSNPGSLPDHNQTDADALRDDIERILKNATTSDTTAADALRSIVKSTPYGFADVSYKDRDSAATALKEAEKLAALAKNPKDLSKEEFDELNRGMAKYKGDDLFAERFATKLGPKGTLELWASVNDIRDSSDLMRERRGQYEDMQKNLSLTLANATQSDSPAMRTWERDMVNLGDSQIQTGRSQTHGFTIMSSLMRHGDYDDKFLNDYGSKLMATEKKMTNSGTAAESAWNNPSALHLNYTGTDTGRDPMTGYMEALGNSPEAATKFFSDDYGDLKSDDHEKTLSNFDYLFEEREWPNDVNSKMEDSVAGRNSMGHALEAATTGHPAGEKATADLPPHNREQAQLYENIVESVSEDTKRLTDHGYLSDSFGRITAEYMPDVSRSMSDATLGNTDKLFPIAGAEAKMDHQDLTRFLVSVGQNPEGYSAIYAGQQSYTANLMDYQLNPDVPESQRYPGSPEDAIREISARSGEIGGTLAVGRQEAVLGEAEVDDKAFKDALSQGKNIASGVIGTGIGVGATFIASPVGGAVAGGAAGTVSSVLLEEIFGGESSAKGDAMIPAGREYENSYDANILAHQRAAELAAGAHDIPHKGSAADWARWGSEVGFNSASTHVRRMAGDLETDV